MSQESQNQATDVSSTVDSSPEAERSKASISPGEMLRQAREAHNLTIADLAGQTRLSRAVLESLEKNDFGNLAMPVYVRGYFRKCAHVMNMPEERLLQAYADWTGTPLKPQPVPVTVNEPPREYASPSRTPSWRYVMIIAIVLGAVLWWFGSGDELARHTPVSTSTPLTTLEIEPPAFEAGAAQDGTTDGPGLASESVVAQPMILPPAPSTAGAPAGTAPLPLQPEAAPGAVPAAPETSPAAAPSPVGPATLQFTFSQTSWVEVRDDDNRQLLYGLMSPGTQQTITGKPPYNIVLGRPQGVKLSMGSKTIDLAPHTSSSGTARLELGLP